jgi:hypothetical protein
LYGKRAESSSRRRPASAGNLMPFEHGFLHSLMKNLVDEKILPATAG